MRETSLPAVPEHLRGIEFMSIEEHNRTYVVPQPAPDPPFVAPFPSVFADMPGVGTAPPTAPKSLTVVPGALLPGFGSSYDDATAINWALSRVPCVRLLPYPYSTFTPIVVPPLGALGCDGGSTLAYYAGSTPMPLGGAVIIPQPGFTTAAIGGQTVAGAIVLVSQNLGGYGTGSGNQQITGITVDGRQAPAGTNGLEAWGPVWGLSLSNCGFYGLPQYGVMTSTSAADGTGKAPDLWRVTGVHIAASGSDGWNATGGVADSYFSLSESTANGGSGWALTGANQRWLGCKAEFNTVNGWRLSTAGGSGTAGSDGAYWAGCSTDHNGQDGFWIGGANGAGPVSLDGCSLHGDGYASGAGGGGYAGLRVTSTNARVLCSNLRVLTVSGITPFPQYGVRNDGSASTVVVTSGLVYGNTAATDNTSTGTLTAGATLLTGTGAWGS